MQKRYEWLEKMKKRKMRRKRWRECINKSDANDRVRREVLDSCTKSRRLQHGEEERTDPEEKKKKMSRLLDRCEAERKEKEWTKH